MRARSSYIASWGRPISRTRPQDSSRSVLGKGEPETRLLFEEVGADLARHPFVVIFPQYEHERLLIATLERLGVSVERNTELLGYSDERGQVIARLCGPDGREERCEAAYIAGCEAARSVVRETIGTGFAGGPYHHLLYVADVEASGPAVDGDIHVDLDAADLLILFPLAGKGRARLIGTVREGRADRADTLNFEDASGRVIENFKVNVEKVNWFSNHIHHRVAYSRAAHRKAARIPMRPPFAEMKHRQ
jgi:2-polyprenyl-6-methoxyphenol hydroxylase-like FAD-dependent oxidoreductase